MEIRVKTSDEMFVGIFDIRITAYILDLSVSKDTTF